MATYEELLAMARPRKNLGQFFGEEAQKLGASLRGEKYTPPEQDTFARDLLTKVYLQNLQQEARAREAELNRQAQMARLRESANLRAQNKTPKQLTPPSHGEGIKTTAVVSGTTVPTMPYYQSSLPNYQKLTNEELQGLVKNENDRLAMDELKIREKLYPEIKPRRGITVGLYNPLRIAPFVYGMNESTKKVLDNIKTEEDLNELLDNKSYYKGRGVDIDRILKMFPLQ